MSWELMTLMILEQIARHCFDVDIGIFCEIAGFTPTTPERGRQKLNHHAYSQRIELPL